jgi:hypothetical protein
MRHLTEDPCPLSSEVPFDATIMHNAARHTRYKANDNFSEILKALRLR